MTASFEAKIKGWIVVCFVCLFVFFCPFLGGGKGEILEITTRRLKTTLYGHFSAKKQAGKWINHKDYLSDMINISLNNIDINMGYAKSNSIRNSTRRGNACIISTLHFIGSTRAYHAWIFIFLFFILFYYRFTPLHNKQIMKWNKLTLL